MALSLSSIADIVINLAGPSLTRQGFGIPLVYSNTGNAWATPELTRTYDISDNLLGVAADFAATTPEYQAIAAIAAQSPHPTTVMVGKGSHIPTQIKNVSISSVVAGATYKIKTYNAGSLQSASVVARAATAWVAATVYAAGYLLTNDTGKLYICITGGTSAAGPATGPSGTAADITDGTVHWMYAGTGGVGATTNDSIVYDLVAVLNGLPAPFSDNVIATISGSVGSKIVVCTANVAGRWFTLELIASADSSAVSNLMALSDVTTLPSGLSDDLTAILNASSAWYALIPLFKSLALITTSSTGIGPWCNANKRLLVCAFSDTASATAVDSGATDALHVLKAAGGSYTAGQFHPRDYEWLDASTLGYFLPKTPGSDNWTLKTLSGPTEVNYTGTQITNIEDRRAAYYTELGSTGDSVLAGKGMVSSTTYAFIDNRRNLDWYAVNLRADLVELIYQSDKVPNTTAGRRSIASVITARNDATIAAGIMSPDALDPTNQDKSLRILTPYTVFVPPVSDATSFNSATRTLSGIKSQWKLAGAIDSMQVNVYVTQ